MLTSAPILATARHYWRIGAIHAVADAVPSAMPLPIFHCCAMIFIDDDDAMILLLSCYILRGCFMKRGAFQRWYISASRMFISLDDGGLIPPLRKGMEASLKLRE